MFSCGFLNDTYTNWGPRSSLFWCAEAIQTDQRMNFCIMACSLIAVLGGGGRALGITARGGRTAPVIKYGRPVHHGMWQPGYHGRRWSVGNHGRGTSKQGSVGRRSIEQGITRRRSTERRRSSGPRSTKQWGSAEPLRTGLGSTVWRCTGRRKSRSRIHSSGRKERSSNRFPTQRATTRRKKQCVGGDFCKIRLSDGKTPTSDLDHIFEI